MKENQITIDIKSYGDLLYYKRNYDILIKFILENTELFYTNKELSLNSQNILDIVKVIEPTLYNNRLCKLKNENPLEED